MALINKCMEKSIDNIKTPISRELIDGAIRDLAYRILKWLPSAR